jgi:hypothetical protein
MLHLVINVCTLTTTQIDFRSAIRSRLGPAKQFAPTPWLRLSQYIVLARSDPMRRRAEAGWTASQVEDERFFDVDESLYRELS